MKNSTMIVRILGGLLVVLGGASSVSPQTAQATAPATDSFVIYAKAGRINLAEGEVRSRRTDLGASVPVTTAYEIAVGDIVSTGPAARLEVLLSPGSFLRVGENAEFQMLSTSLENIHFVLRRGSALIETGGTKEFSSHLRVSTPSGLAYVSSNGLYRVDIVSEGTIFTALHGALTLGSKTVTLKDGERVTVTGAGAGPVAKIARSSSPDMLEVWSHQRADQLAAASRRLDRKRLMAAMRNLSTGDPFVGSMRGSPGVWGSDGSSGVYTFIPVLSDWRSPYGYGYLNLSGSTTRYGGMYTGMVPGPRGFPTPPMRLQEPKPVPPPPLPTRLPGSN